MTFISILSAITIIYFINRKINKWEETKMTLINNPNSPMYNWKITELDPETIFPWEDVLNSKIITDAEYNIFLSEYLGESYKQYEKQMGSRLKNEDNFIIYFRSPDITWEKLCGQEGYLTISKKQKKQIDFIRTVMN